MIFDVELQLKYYEEEVVYLRRILTPQVVQFTCSRKVLRQKRKNYIRTSFSYRITGIFIIQLSKDSLYGTLTAQNILTINRCSIVDFFL